MLGMNAAGQVVVRAGGEEVALTKPIEQWTEGSSAFLFPPSQFAARREQFRQLILEKWAAMDEPPRATDGSHFPYK